MRAFRLLLMLSLLFTGVAGAGDVPLHPVDCAHGEMAMDEAQSHAHDAGASKPMHDCCEEDASCSSDCRMSCAASTGLPPQPVAATRLPGRAEVRAAPRAELPVAPPDELLRPPRTRSL